MQSKQRCAWANWSFHINLTAILILAIFLLGCQASSSAPAEAKLATVTTASTTSIPNPTLTETPSFPILSVSSENPGQWSFSTPYSDPSSTHWIIPGKDGYELDNGYAIQSIDLSYEWWGLADPVLNYQQLKRSGTGYLLDGKPVPVAKVSKLLGSIARLHAEPLMLSSITHTDDYPEWGIELRGTDGSDILLISSSNGPASVPWNVIYNGSIYAQFDGSITSSINDLFSVNQGEPMAAFFPGGGEEGKIIVNSRGWPNQMVYGFNGLLPLQSGFNYWPDPAKGEITGYVEGRSSIGGMGHMIIGSVTTLGKMTLQDDAKNTITCKIEPLESNDPAAKRWGFHCPASQSAGLDKYRYGVHIVFGTDKGAKASVDGELFGHWKGGIAFPNIPFPEEVSRVLADYVPFQQLARDHKILLLDFDSQTDPASGQLDQALNGDVVLLGQTRLDGKLLRYSATSAFGIQDGRVVRWDLTLEKLKSLLDDVLRQPAAQKQLNPLQNPVLNLYYSEAAEGANMAYSEGSSFIGGPITSLTQCAGLPWRKRLPASDMPFRGFAINQTWGHGGAQMALMGDVVRVLDFDGSTKVTSDNPISALFPGDLSLPDQPALEINANQTWGPYIQFIWPADSPQTDLDAYKAMIEKWPGEKEYDSWGVGLNNAIFILDAEGTLKLVGCK